MGVDRVRTPVEEALLVGFANSVGKRDQAKLAYLSMQNNSISTISTKENKRKEKNRYAWFTQLGYVHEKVVFYYLQNISSILQESNAKNPNIIQKD